MLLDMKLLETQPLCMVYDFKTDSAYYLPVKFPPINHLQNKIDVHYHFSACFANDTFYYNFPYNHAIYYTTDHITLHPMNCASSFFTEFNTGEIPVDDFTRYLFNSNSYANLIYDKHRNVFYRIIELAYLAKDQEDVQNMRKYHPRFAIMVLDHNLRILGETRLPDKMYMAELLYYS